MNRQAHSKRRDALGIAGLVVTLPALFLVLGERFHVRNVETKVNVAIHLMFALGSLFLLLTAAAEFDSDSARHFLRKTKDGARKCVKAVPVRVFFGVLLKMLAVLNGVAALVGGVALSIKLEAASVGIQFVLPSGIPLSFLPHDMNAITLGLVVGWLWAATVLGYLGGDGWLAGARQVRQAFQPDTGSWNPPGKGIVRHAAGEDG